MRHERLTLGGGEAYMTDLELHLNFSTLSKERLGWCHLVAADIEYSIFPQKIPEAHPISGIQMCLEGAEHF